MVDGGWGMRPWNNIHIELNGTLDVIIDLHLLRNAPGVKDQVGTKHQSTTEGHLQVLNGQQGRVVGKWSHLSLTHLGNPVAL